MTKKAARKESAKYGIASTAALGLREIMSYAIPGGSGMRSKKCMVGIKCKLVEEFTKPDSIGGSDPEWHHNRGCVHVSRRKDDGGVAKLSMYQLHKDGHSRSWVGGNEFKFSNALREPDKEFTKDIPLYVSGTPEGGAGSGVVSIKFKWVRVERTCNLEDQEKDPQRNGELVVNVLSAKALVMPDRIVRDLTTYVDGTPVIFASLLLAVYMVTGFVFYYSFMDQSIGHAAELKKFPKLLDRVQGGFGDWDTLNTLVFMVTSFTTVGYGNHPSLVATLPPCEVPGPRLSTDDPFSVLLPQELRPKSVKLTKIPGMNLAEENTVHQSFPAMSAACFDIADPMDHPVNCMYIADDTYIFDFHNLLLWKKHSMELPRNLSGVDRALELYSLDVPGDIGVYDCSHGAVASAGGGGSSSEAETQKECYARFAKTCEEQLAIWRQFEQQKDIAKVFTAVFIMLGIGILGAVVGAVGETLMEWVHNLLGGVEYTMATATQAATVVAAPISNAAAPITDVVGRLPIDVDGVASHMKQFLVAMIGLCIVIMIGAVVYASTESLKWIDAVYFTVVTATTVGFGDYYPESTSGKMFTVFYVPFSVVAVAGLINHVAAIPLESRRHHLEQYVLAQFGTSLTQLDVDDIRRSAAISSDVSIRANDFLVAMALRLGYLKPEDCQQIKRLFEGLDATGDGELTVEDIRGLVMSSPVDSPYPRDPDEPLVATPPPVGTRPSTIRRLGSMDRQLSIELLSSDSLQDNDQFTSVDIGGGKGGDHDTGVNSNPVAYDSNTV